MGSDAVDAAYKYESMLDWTYYYDMLFPMPDRNTYNLDVLVYEGEYDQRDGPTSQGWISTMKRFGYDSQRLWNQARKIYYVP
jgi:hypothetical protein